ncbi:MAG: hypothetical protein JSU63_04005 [Phycisphaerales bacterium]|nr:MAG: hypothetical protein JSU63_04005 [Phycisphaerales bacterium]
MTLHSSTSSSSSVLEPPAVAVATASLRGRPVESLSPTGRAPAAVSARRWPRGGIIACALVAVAHVAISTWVFPHPIAREELRRKVIAIPQGQRPSLIFAGDSRAWWHIDPAVVAENVDLPAGKVVNIAINSCESSGVLAAYREFSDRFAPAPIIVISISAYSINDGVTYRHCLNDEVLWSVGLLDRFRLASVKDAIQATFLPERELANRIARAYYETKAFVPPEEGFWEIPAKGPLDWTSDHTQERLSFIRDVWFENPSMTGIRWRQLEEDLQDLKQGGAQVVLLDSPEHPQLADRLEGTPSGTANAAFHRQLHDLGKRMQIPVLRGGPDWLGDRNADELYCDPVHMNRLGAELFSASIGTELRNLLNRGVLLPKAITH